MTFDLGVIKRQRYTSPTYAGLGGIVSYYTDINGIAYTAHTFLGSALFTVFSPTTMDCLVVAAGGAGTRLGGGGGGFRTTSTIFSVGVYTITVGAGVSGSNGQNSSIVGGSINFESAGGGKGQQDGGSGGGGFASVNIGHGNVPATSPSQGYDGGGVSVTGGGGGGAGGTTTNMNGGPGAYNDYSGISTPYAGGGGAGGDYTVGSGSGSGGIGGGGNGAYGTGYGGSPAPGSPNTGGGGGGAYSTNPGAGGSGIIIIRYPTPIISTVPPKDIYFNYVSLLLSNQITNVTTPTIINTNVIPKIEYIAVAGGGGAGQESGGYPQNYHLGGGGGGGGVVIGTLTNVLLSSSNTFIVTVGSGGPGGGFNMGYSSSIISRSVWGITTSSIIAYGGGGGGIGANGNSGPGTGGISGGSGGGGGGGYGGGGSGGLSMANLAGYVNLVDVGKGNNGGAGGGRGATFNWAYGGGGGGAGGAGTAGGQDTGGNGGAAYTWLNGTAYAAGGWGRPLSGSITGTGNGTAGAANTGNGGTVDGTGGNGAQPAGPPGGSGIVIFRYSGTNVLATGGTISTLSNYVYHSFTVSSTLIFAPIDGAIGLASTSSTIRSLLVGGGGGGDTATFSGTPGGGGAGGVTTGTFTITNVSTLLSISIGAGGSGTGGDSSITSNYITKIAYGGGAGAGGSGGSGGGATGYNPGTSGPGAATQPSSASGGYGNAGGTGNYSGGGGAGGVGTYPAGGPGLYINTPSSTYSKVYAAGGAVLGGDSGVNATSNTGNGGGSKSSGSGGVGGSGIAIIWEPSSNNLPTLLGNPIIITTSGFRVYVFNSSGAIVFNPSLSNNQITDSSFNSYVPSPANSPTQGSFNPYTANWSTYFDGNSYISLLNTSSYGTTTLDLTNNDFTIEGWAYFNSIASGQLIGHTGSTWRIVIGSGGTLVYYISSNNASWNIAAGLTMGTVTVGRWYHFALVRSGSTFTPYLNGVAGTTAVSASSIYSGYPYDLWIGRIDGGYFQGYLSNIRILKGTAYYNNGFTPAITPLPLVSNTLLLTCASSIAKDKSSYNWPILITGSPVVKKFSPFANIGSYNTTFVGGSAYFNGTSDYITINNTTTAPNWTYLHDGTTDYTIEGWIYPLTTASNLSQELIGTSDAAVNPNVPGMQLRMYGNLFYWTLLSGNNFFNLAGGNVITNAWNNIACTFASSNKTVNLYLNGVKVTTGAITTASFTATSASYPLTIGKNPIAGTGYFSGYMSNLRILKGVISDGVVTTNLSVGTTFEYLIVAGGGSGSGVSSSGYGGGGGGFRTGTVITTQSGAIYIITVGNGGANGQGGNSSLVGGGINVESAGGGYTTGSGGSGGGNGGTGNVPATIPPQGYNGGTGGGGGAAAAGSGLNGGPGAYSNIDGLQYYYSGGGGGGGGMGVGGNGGTGGGGYGTGLTNLGNSGGSGRNDGAYQGGANTGGGGGAGAGIGYGGSGIVIIRYLGPQRAVGGNVTTNISGYTVHTFLASGTLVDNIQTYTVPTAPVIASSTNTNLLLNFTDAKITDASLNTDIATLGDIGLLSNIKKYNNMSMFFDGVTDSLVLSTSTAIGLGAGDFTVEMWLYPLTVYNTGNAPALLDARIAADGAGLIRFGYNGTVLSQGAIIGWKENTSYIVTATIATGSWQHVAVVRNSGSMKMYINGAVSNNTASNTTNYVIPFKYIGASYNSLYWNGYMDDLRITNGVARYTSSFVVPTYKPQLK